MSQKIPIVILASAILKTGHLIFFTPISIQSITAPILTRSTKLLIAPPNIRERESSLALYNIIKIAQIARAVIGRKEIL